MSSFINGNINFEKGDIELSNVKIIKPDLPKIKKFDPYMHQMKYNQFSPRRSIPFQPRY